MSLSVSRNKRSTVTPQKKTWAEVAAPDAAKDNSHFALLISDTSSAYQHALDAMQDMMELQKTYGGEIFSFTGQEWHERCKAEDSEFLSPVGAQFSKTYSILIFSMSLPERSAKGSVVEAALVPIEKSAQKALRELGAEAILSAVREWPEQEISWSRNFGSLGPWLYRFNPWSHDSDQVSVFVEHQFAIEHDHKICLAASPADGRRFVQMHAEITAATGKPFLATEVVRFICGEGDAG